MKIEHYGRDGRTDWRRSVLRRDDTVFLAGLHLGIPLSEIYAGLEVTDGTNDLEPPFDEDDG